MNILAGTTILEKMLRLIHLMIAGLTICSIIFGSNGHCCKTDTAVRIQQNWQKVMGLLDTKAKKSVVHHVVMKLEKTAPHAADVISGRLVTDPEIIKLGPTFAYIETLRQLGIIVDLMTNPKALNRQVKHYVLNNHVHEGDEAQAVAEGLEQLFSAFMKASGLDQSQWGSCISDVMTRVQNKAAEESGRLYAQCDITPDTGHPGQPIYGQITFEQPISGGSTVIKGEIHGFDTVDNDKKHGFHIHTTGALGNACKDAGGHYNPELLTHGGPQHIQRHVGDLGNIEEDENGAATIYKWDHKVSLSGQHSVLNRAIVIHATTDDLGQGGYADSKTTGHAGARLGCCIILPMSKK